MIRKCSWIRRAVYGLLALLAPILPAADSAPAAEAASFGFGDRALEGGTLPSPWRLLGNPRSGRPEFRVVEDDAHGPVLRFHAEGNESDGVYRSAPVDLTKTPYVNFSWKVDVLPDGQVGTAKDDQAVQVQLDFGRYRFRRRVLSYGYDAAAKPDRWYDDSSAFAHNRVLVLDSGDEKLGEWVGHSRNVRDDFRTGYRARPPALRSISIFSDSNDSHSQSLGYCTAITFSREPLFEK